jgi:hypothetical protein
MDTTNNSECYACLEVKPKMLKPCPNKLCNARICSDCIHEQIKNNNDRCGLCREPIIINSNINVQKCLLTYLKLIFISVMYIGGSVSVVYSLLGNTVRNWIKCNNYKDFCDDGAYLLMIPTLFYIGVFMQGHLWRCCCPSGKYKYNVFCCGFSEKIKCKTPLTIFIMICVSNLLIFFGHIMGSPFIKYFYGKDLFYTWRTSVAGFIIYVCGIGLVVLMWIAIGLYNCIMKDAEERFGAPEYGQLLDDM